MGSIVRERFSPRPIGVNGNYVVKGTHIAGFLCTVTGSLSITANDANGNAITYVDTLPVTAGAYVKIPMEVTAPDITVTLAGGAAGTLFI